MALTTQQIDGLKKQLDEQRVKLEDVLAGLKAGDPTRNDERTNDNADVGTEATESNDIVAYESLERETQILLDRTTQALERIANGTYGRTDEGVEIPFERLQIEPTATTTVS